MNKHKQWSAIIVGDEKREKIKFNHKQLFKLGFLEHNKVLSLYKKSSIAVVCSRWDEPFGRTSLEAAANGNAVIISKKGGLPETITNGIVLKNLTVDELTNEINNLIKNDKLRKNLQRLSIKNFYLTNVEGNKDNYRDEKLRKINIFNVLQEKKSFHYNTCNKF